MLRACGWVVCTGLLVGGCIRVVGLQNPNAKELGAACSSPADCGSGICADGVCCDSACGDGRGCNLPRSPGQCVPREAGDPCAPGESRACGSLACVEENGVALCCSGDCAAPTASCQVPGFLGACVPREIGNACRADADCPQGTDGAAHCVDGVCCSSACSGRCERCDMPLTPGSCTLSPDNTDPDQECGGLAGNDAACTACFGGVCLPALAGTDPKALCADGMVCGNNASCGVAVGGDCNGAVGCAQGACLLGHCVGLQVEVVPVSLAGTRADRLIAKGVTVTRDDAVTLVWDEVTDISSTFNGNHQLGIARQVGGQWVSRSIPHARSGSGFLAQVTSVGTYSLLITAPSTSAYCGVVGACDIHAQWIQPDGVLGVSETVWQIPRSDDPFLDPTGKRVCSLAAQTLEDDSVLLMVALGSEGVGCQSSASEWEIHPLRRSPAGVWDSVLSPGVFPSPTPMVANTYGVVSCRMVNDEPVLVDLTPDFRLRATVGTRPSVVLDACADVVSASGAAAVVAPLGNGIVQVGGGCDAPQGAFLAELDVRSGEGPAWTYRPFPPSSNPNQRAVAGLFPVRARGTSTSLLQRYTGTGFLNYGLFNNGMFSETDAAVTPVSNPPTLTSPLVAVGTTVSAAFMTEMLFNETSRLFEEVGLYLAVIRD